MSMQLRGAFSTVQSEGQWDSSRGKEVEPQRLPTMSAQSHLCTYTHVNRKWQPLCSGSDCDIVSICAVFSGAGVALGVLQYPHRKHKHWYTTVSFFSIHKD